MNRRLIVRPDRVLVKPDGEELLVCSREALREAFLDLESILAVAGGVGAIAVQRAPTGMEGEMATTGAILEWKDAPIARPKVERAQGWEDVEEAASSTMADAAGDDLTAEEIDMHFPDPEVTEVPPVAMPFGADEDEAQPEAAPGPPPPVARRADLEDGVIRDESGEPEEDISAIPETRRALVA